MSNIKHIVFPVDFSERSDRAVPFVAEMARQHDSKVTLIAVAHPYYASGMPEAAMVDPQMILDDVKEQLDRTYVNDFAGLCVNRLAILGDPARVIADFAAANKVDLVMMPTHGYGPFRQLLLGSVTAKVLHDANVPVWTTPHSGDTPGREHLKVRKILCAVDAGPQSVGLMRSAAQLSKSLGATLRLVHAVPGIEAWPERPMDTEFEETVRENARHSIEKLEKDADIEVPVCVGVGAVSDVVREEAMQHDVDLVVIGRGVMQGALGRLRTHCYGIIRHAPCPVLSV